MFLLQSPPYVPLGDLLGSGDYPSEPGDIPDDALRAMLTKVALPHLVDRLDDTEDWPGASPGEQQRVAFARSRSPNPGGLPRRGVLGARRGLETMLYTLVRTELPDTVLVSVSTAARSPNTTNSACNCSATARPSRAGQRPEPVPAQRASMGRAAAPARRPKNEPLAQQVA